MEMVGASTEGVEASMGVSGVKCCGSTINVSVKVYMEAPEYFRGSSSHGSFHGSSGSFQEILKYLGLL